MRKWICLLLACLLLPLPVRGADPELSVIAPAEPLIPWETALIRYTLPEAGTVQLTLTDGEGREIMPVARDVQGVAGKNTLFWNGTWERESAPAGVWRLRLDAGDAHAETEIVIAGEAPAVAARPAESLEPLRLSFTPATTSPWNGRDASLNYWTLPIGDFNEEAIWEVMMQPMTVIVEKGKTQRDVYRLRATPDSEISKENVVGEITYESQGVHVLDTLDNGWSLVEVYNSSYGPYCASRRGYGVTDDLIRGYVKTSLLTTLTPRTDYGLLIDKLEQKLYIFSEGKCIGVLLVSTGLNNSKQVWNETPAGEFVMISRMGGFAAGNLWCAYGMRINGGCAIHEVPYIGTADTPAANRDYSSTVKLLGQKASHGCIRVQKAANEQGQNIKWLWDNIKVNTKVLIWDDTGRKRSYPVADDYELYYNPDGGKYFHENQNCPSVKSRFLPLSPFTYGELDSGSFAKLTPCPKCTTLLRKSQIDAMNALEN